MMLHSHHRDDDGSGSESGDLEPSDVAIESSSPEDTLEKEKRKNPPGLL